MTPRGQYEAWVLTQKPGNHYALMTNVSYYQVWLSRQPEIDVLENKIEDLKYELRYLKDRED